MLKRLGEGGIARVYLGIQEKSDLRVAIKILEPRLHQDKTLARRFFQEIETISSLDYPNIIKIYDSGQIRNFYYLVMEYLESSLRDRIDGAKGACLWPQESDTIKQIAAALDYAHQQGIVHRDIKPENIMFRTDGTPVLVDFGLAKVLQSGERLTRTGITVGTPAYMSPEQVEGQPLDGRADFYSLGVIFYELLVGEVPYKAQNYLALARKHLVKKVPKLPRKLRSFQPLLNKLMAKNRDERISSGAELITLIDHSSSHNLCQ